MRACASCGSSARLRFDRGLDTWTCVDACGGESVRRRTSRPRRPALFHNYVVEDGQRRRATRDELRDAYRLWAVHADVRGAA